MWYTLHFIQIFIQTRWKAAAQRAPCSLDGYAYRSKFTACFHRGEATIQMYKNIYTFYFAGSLRCISTCVTRSLSEYLIFECAPFLLGRSVLFTLAFSFFIHSLCWHWCQNHFKTIRLRNKKPDSCHFKIISSTFFFISNLRIDNNNWSTSFETVNKSHKNSIFSHQNENFKWKKKI